MASNSAAPIQQPVHYAITAGAPTRIGGLIAPYTLINGDVNGTIWLADNPGLQAGLGTPLHPGTSLVWNRPGDFWAISEPTFTNTLIISDVTDWEPDPAAVAAAVLNAGVLVIDDPVPLATISVTGPGFTTPIDISRYQSLNISILLDVEHTSGNDDYITVSFGDGGITTYSFSLQYTLEDQLWTAAVPCYGDSVRFFIGTPSNFDIFVAGSHRAIQTVRQRIDAVGGTEIPTDLFFTLRATAGTAPLLAGTTYSIDLPPWHGELELDASLSSAAAPGGSSEIRWTRQNRVSGAYNAFRRLAFRPVQGVLYAITDRIACNGDALRLDVVNNGANNWSNIGIRITPVSGALVS